MGLDATEVRSGEVRAVMTEDRREQSLLRYVPVALLALVIICYPLVAGKNFTPQNLAMHCLLTVAALVWYLWGRPGRSTVAEIGPGLVDRSLVAFAAICLLVTPFSVCKYASLLFIVWVCDCLIMLWVAREAVADGPSRRILAWAIVGAGALCAILGVREYVQTVYFLANPSWRIFGPLYNPNILASYLTGALFLGLGLLMVKEEPPPAETPKRRRREPEPASVADRPRYGAIVLGFSVLLVLAALFLTGSRAGLGAMLVGLGVFIVLRAPHGAGRRRAAAIGVVAIVVCVAAALAIPTIRPRVLETFTVWSHSWVFRYYTWLGTMDMVAARPLQGFGPGTFMEAYPGFARAGFTRTAHQSFLQVAAEVGVFGLLAMVCAGLGALIACVRRAAEDHATTRALAAAAAGWLVALGVHNLVDYSLYVPAVSVTACALLGVALGGDAGERRIRARRRVIVPVLGGLVLIGAWLLGAELLTARADTLTGRRQFYAAEQAAVWATRLSPFSPGAWETLGGVSEAQLNSADSPQLQRAIEARQRAARLAPTEPKNYIALADLYGLEGEPERGLEYAERAVAVYPTGTRGLAALAKLQEQAGQEDEAEATYRRLLALRESPVGRYEAVPELPEADYVWAYSSLGLRALEAGDTETGQQMLYNGLELLNARLRGEELTMDMALRYGGGPTRQMQRFSEMAGAAEAALARHPDALNKLRLAEAWGRLRERARQESLLLDIIDYSRARDNATGWMLGAVAYLELGEAYALAGEERLSEQAYAEGLELLGRVPDSTVASGGEVEGRRAVSVERLTRLKQTAQSADN